MRKKLITGMVVFLVASFAMYAGRGLFAPGTPQDRLLGGLSIGAMAIAIALNFVLVLRKSSS